MELASIQLALGQDACGEKAQSSVAELPHVACEMQTDSAVDNSVRPSQAVCCAGQWPATGHVRSSHAYICTSHLKSLYCIDLHRA